jgi:hypothetical protein
MQSSAGLSETRSKNASIRDKAKCQFVRSCQKYAMRRTAVCLTKDGSAWNTFFNHELPIAFAI